MPRCISVLMVHCRMYSSTLICFVLILKFIEVRVVGGYPEVKTSNCGYQSCPKVDPEKLNVHIVAHTHDDVGWLKTVDQYYYGSNTKIQKAGVQYILDSVIEALLRDPKRKFIYVETAFLWKWWQRQDEKKRQDVRLLINEGRLEIIGGAWSMNDEATTHYHSTIDQFTWGLRRLNDTFGECARPKIGWQIDPFGHSREQASIFAQLGFDGMFLGRLDYQDKAHRLRTKTPEFIWKASSNLGKKADLFSVALFNTYSPPPGFCFDVLCSDDPLIDDPDSPDKNIDIKIKDFYDYLKKQALYYRTNNIILTMGGDFTYQQAEMYLMNLDVLISYTNKIYGSIVNVFYSTPSCYIKAVNDAQKTWKTKYDDFFPYSSDPHAFWTGYFTSRPTLKYFERMGNNLLQIVKQLSVSSNVMDSDDLIHFREVMGIMQHHDAVTGTEKQHVAADYVKLLHDSMVKGSHIVARAISTLMMKEKSNDDSGIPKFHSCFQLNISSCDVTETTKNFITVIYNPESQPLTTYIRIPVTGRNYIVKDYLGAEITSQLMPIPEVILRLPGRVSASTRELIFIAKNVPAIGYSTYYISDVSGNSIKDDIIYPAKSSSINGKIYNISVDENGNVVIESKKHDVHVVQSFHYYEGMKGNNSESINRASGAYIFRPTESAIHNFEYAGDYKIYKGPLIQEIHLVVNEYVSQVVRLCLVEDKIEFEWLIGPIPVNDSIGREIITKYTSNLESDKIFYTDSNAREMLKRIRDYRPTWNVTLNETISGNYYPVTSKIFIEDNVKALRLTVLNDRAQGGTSMIDGQVELMLHRRLLNDDAFGVGEALNEQAFGEGLVVRGMHYLLINNLNDANPPALSEKTLATKLALRPWLLFSPIDEKKFQQLRDNNVVRRSALKQEIRSNIHVLTYEPWKDDKVLLRLEHIFEVGEAGSFSAPVDINLAVIFADFNIVSIRETTLGGNQWIEEMTRLIWRSESTDEINDHQNKSERVVVNDKNNIHITLEPMEIRTFILTVTRKL